MAAELRFSIIIPTFNREALLQRLVQSILSQEVKSFELIIVNDGGTELLPFNDERIRIISQPNSGPAVARNNGASHASGEIFVFVDDDCLLPMNFFNDLLLTFQEYHCDAVAGKTVNGLPENIFSRTYQATTDYFSSVLNKEEGKAFFVTTNNFSCKRETFLQIGGFDVQFRRGAEDREFAARMIRHGKKIVFSERTAIGHFHHFTFLSFIKHNYQHGKGSFLLRQINRNLLSPGSNPPPSIYFSVYFFLMKQEGFRSVVIFAASEMALMAGYLMFAVFKRM